MARPYSDLQVDPEPNLPEVVQEQKIACGDGPDQVVVFVDPLPSRRICGLPLRRFCIVLSVAIVIFTAAAVGGAVGGTHALTPSISSTPIPIASTSSSAPVSFSTSTQFGPTKARFRDCPSSNDTIYKAAGSDCQFRKLCNFGFRWSGQNVLDTVAASLDDCIELCVAYNENNRSAIDDSKSSLCNGVCWRNSIRDDDRPGQCFGAPIQNSTATGLPVTRETSCDSAAWINQHVA
ncbi:hypothetical protein ED733_007263 [Metarhizium rileyi]|uniref:Apple domain-containing protein n=1 Tax=Metarhizium rileyi (strain RCEF 4871) TaxID=1649241 RepID=A0A5C6GGN9_METRR|nr:hypothetical protein ED733_007263 [Metarhizium rileyi]